MSKYSTYDPRDRQPKGPQQEYQHRGYALYKNLFPPGGNGKLKLSRLLLHYANHVDTSFRYSLNNSAADPNVKVELNQDFLRAGFSRRLAILLALNGREVFDGMSVALNSMHKGFNFPVSTPAFYTAAVYDIIFNGNLLEAVSGLLGNDFILGPRLQPVIRLCHDELELIDILSRQLDQDRFECQSLFNVHVGGAPWYSNSQHCLSAAAQSEVVNVCIALTGANSQNGGYSVIPCSHLYPQRRSPSLFELRNQQRIELHPGQVLCFDNHLFVSHQCNQWEKEPFIALTLQFYPTGSFGGFPHLPGFRIHRSDSGALLIPTRAWWSRKWQQSIASLSVRKLSSVYRVSDQHEATRLSKYFKELEDQLN